MDEHEWLAERFEEHRHHLRAVAYRMLGSVSEATTRSRKPGCASAAPTTREIENLDGWLTTVVARCA